jgi:hypothetical protein
MIITRTCAEHTVFSKPNDALLDGPIFLVWSILNLAISFYDLQGKYKTAVAASVPFWMLIFRGTYEEPASISAHMESYRYREEAQRC